MSEDNPTPSRIPTPQTSKIVLILIALILLSFVVGAYRVQLQADQIAQIIDDQSPLVFSFQNTGTSGRITFIVTCTREEDTGNYLCVTKQTEPVVANLTPVPSPTPSR